MDSKIIEILSEEIRETRSLTVAVREETKELRRIAEAAERKADAAWELVVMTRNQIQEDLAYLRKPIWKKWFGG